MDTLQPWKQKPTLCKIYPPKPGTSDLTGRVVNLDCGHSYCQPCLLVIAGVYKVNSCPQCKTFLSAKDLDTMMAETNKKAEHTLTHLTVDTPPPRRLSPQLSQSAVPRIPRGIECPEDLFSFKSPPQTGNLGGRTITALTPGTWYPGWPGPRK